MICPSCKINDVDLKSYRDNGGCVGSVLTCLACDNYNDRVYYALKEHDTPEQVIEYLKTIFNKRPNAWLSHIVWPEESQSYVRMMNSLAGKTLTVNIEE